MKPFLPLLSLLLALASPAFAAKKESADQLLRESLNAPKSVSYLGQAQTVRFSSNGATATLARIEHKAPAFTRRWYLAPGTLYGNYIITRGNQTYRFDTRHARLTVSHNPMFDDAALSAGKLALVLRNYRIVPEGTEMLANQHVTVLALINKYSGERAMRLWIDDHTHLILAKESYRSDGSVASQMRFEAIRYTAALPADLFSVKTPLGFTRVEGSHAEVPSPNLQHVIAAIGFKPYTPRMLPQGFSLVGGNIAVTADGIPSLHLLYSDGLHAISLFENDKGAAANFGDARPRTIRFEHHDAHYIEDGSTTLLTWEEQKLHFALVGELNRDELAQIAGSVVP